MATKIPLIKGNEQNRYLVTFLLQKQDYEVVEAFDGPEGIRLAAVEHGRAGESRVGPQVPGDVVPVHARQLDVEQRERRQISVTTRAQGFLAVARHGMRRVEGFLPPGDRRGEP